MQSAICLSRKLVIFTSVCIVILLTSLVFTRHLIQKKNTLSSKASEKKIMGGNASIEGRWSFMARIEHMYKTDEGKILPYRCSGSFIAKHWILTAAHCVISTDKKLYNPTVYLGSVYRSQMKKITISPANIFIHPEYNKEDSLLTFIVNYEGEKIEKKVSAHDLALIKLTEEDVEGYDITTLKLYDLPEPPLEGTRGLILGWGYTDLSYTVSDRLYQGIIPITSYWRYENGNITLDSYRALKDEFIFVGYPNGGVLPVNGDSGGPFVVDGSYLTPQVLLGVFSFFTHNSDGNYGMKGDYAVYGRITKGSKNEQWIQSHLTSDTLNVTPNYTNSQLTSEEIDEYNRRICNSDEWGESLPQICKSRVKKM